MGKIGSRAEGLESPVRRRSAKGIEMSEQDSNFGVNRMGRRVFLGGAAVAAASVGGWAGAAIAGQTVAGKRQSSQEVADLLHRMEGVTVALATPLDEHGELDVPGLKRLIERVVAAGSSCLFPLGWMGEGPLLKDGVREAMMRETCRLANHRLPVMIGVSEQSLPRALDLAAMAQRAGADLILSTPPFSYSIPQNLVYEYFKELAAKSGLPLVIYQNDEVGVHVELETLLRLSTTPGLVGVKAFMPYGQIQRCFHRADRPGRFAVMSGDEYLYGAALLLGIRHFTMGGPGNICPKWCTGIYRSALDNEWAAVTKKQRRLTDFCDAIFIGVDTAYASVKYALKCLGLCEPYISSPHRVIPPEQQKQVEQALKEYADVVAG